MDHDSYKVVIPLTSRHADQVWRLYKQAWWALDRGLTSTIKVIEGSDLNVGVFDASNQLIGYARVITDGVEKAMIFDVIVDKMHRGKKLGRLIIDTIINSDACSSTNHVELYCKEEMKPFYANLGFADISSEVRLLRLAK